MNSQNEKICSCGKKFKNIYNLRRHLKKSHSNDLDTVAPIFKHRENFKYSCEICGKKFNKTYQLHYHERKIHNKQTISETDKKSKNCPMCDKYKSSIKRNLLQHFEKDHNITLKRIQTITFSSADEFNKWKTSFETDTLSNFVIEKTKKRKSYKSIQYACHRAQNFIPKGKGKRNLKTQGSCKIGGFCPASINVKIDLEGIYTVDAIETHVGHRHDVEHLHLSKEERIDLAVKIASKVPFDCILDNIRNGVSDTNLKRIHLLTRKDLHNIKSTFNLRESAENHSNDAIDIDSCDNQMLGECVPPSSVQIGEDTDMVCIETTPENKKVECEQILANLFKNNSSTYKKLNNEKITLIHHLMQKIEAINSAEKLNVVREIVAPISPTLKAMDNVKKSTNVLPLMSKKNNCIPHNKKSRHSGD